MADSLIIKKAIEEIEQRRFGTTEQLLEIHEVVYEDNQPKVLRLDKDCPDGSAIVYFPIKGEKFYLAVYLDTEPSISVRATETEAYHSVYFSASSDSLTLEQLSSLIQIKPTRGWSKGDARNYGKSTHHFSAFYLEPNPEPDEFTDKLNNLLNLLEKDIDGLQAMAAEADVGIQVVSIFHNGNTMLGGHHLDKSTLKRLSDLNLEIDFDLYAEGNFFKE